MPSGLWTRGAKESRTGPGLPPPTGRGTVGECMFSLVGKRSACSTYSTLLARGQQRCGLWLPVYCRNLLLLRTTRWCGAYPTEESAASDDSVRYWRCPLLAVSVYVTVRCPSVRLFRRSTKQQRRAAGLLQLGRGQPISAAGAGARQRAGSVVLRAEVRGSSETDLLWLWLVQILRGSRWRRATSVWCTTAWRRSSARRPATRHRTSTGARPAAGSPPADSGMTRLNYCAINCFN